MLQEKINYKQPTDRKVDVYDILNDGGGECPCCGTTIKPYKVGITPKMVRELQWLVSNCGAVKHGQVIPGDAVAVDISKAPQDIKDSRTVSKLRFFGLVERKSRLTELGKEVEIQGHWRPTAKGIKFLLGLIRVHKTATVFRNDVIALGGEKVYCASISVKDGQVDDV